MSVLCAAALALLLDASGSLNRADWETQIEGHARAFESEAISLAIESNGPIAIRVDAFGFNSRPLINWRLLYTIEDAKQFAADLRANQEHNVITSGTYTAAAISNVAITFRSTPCEDVSRQIIDLVTDGPANDHQSLATVRHYLVENDIQLNGIFVHSSYGDALARSLGYANGFEWIREEVITPTGLAFEAKGWDDFTPVIRRKLILEITNVSFSFGSPLPSLP